MKEYKCEVVAKGYNTEEECKSWPVEKCNVRSELVKKITPETSCHKVPKKLCGPAGCALVQGPKECIDKTEVVVVEVSVKGVGKKQAKQTKQTKQTTWLNMISILAPICYILNFSSKYATS